MKKRILAGALTLCLLLTSGCSSMLDRSFLSIEPHAEHPAAGDSSGLRAESYLGVVSAVQYCVSQGLETGEIQLYNYTRDPEKDLTAACLSVIESDPLAAYAVDYMKHDVTRILSYYKVNLTIKYRRTPEQIASIVTATGSSAVGEELRQTLSSFESETVLRISDFTEDQEYFEGLLHRAYLNTPAAALGEPSHQLNIYPKSGKQRIVEVLLTYPEDVAGLKAKSAQLQTAAQKIADQVMAQNPKDLPQRLFAALRQQALYLSNAENASTAYEALVEGKADSEGIALAWKLLCDLAEIPCTVVAGTDQTGGLRYWTILQTADGMRHVDPTRTMLSYRTDAQQQALGFGWEPGIYPLCGETAPGPVTEKTEKTP